MAISKGAVIKLILKYIGGNPLMQIPTTTVAGQPVAIKAGLGGITSFASQANQIASEAAGLASQLSSVASLVGATDFVSELSGITDKLAAASLLGDQISGISEITSQLSSLSGITSQITNIATIAAETGSISTKALSAIAELSTYSNQISSLSSSVSSLSDVSGSSSALSSLASQIGSSSGGLQEGLSLISQNPLSSTLDSTKNTLVSFTQGGYSGLDAELSGIASNPALADSYSELKLSLGGSDGLTGAVSQLNAYREHTDRLSGVTISSESEFYESQESGSEYLYYYDIPLNTWTTVISFSAKRYRSAKYFIQGTSNNEHQSSEIFVIHDNARVYVREVDQIYTTDPFISFTSQFTDNTVNILANTALPNTDLVIYGIKLEVASKSESKDTITQEKILEGAKSMAGFYPQDTTDYVALQASSLLNPNSVYALQDTINNLTIRMNHSSFTTLSDAEKQQYIRNYANTINTLTAEMQSSIDSDIAAHDEITKKIESASIVYGVSSSYSDPKAKRLLDLTLNESIKSNLK